jgi:ATP-binding cassette, subfamily B, bacterial
LARAFTRNPGLVILDEASSRLDPATESQLDRAMMRLFAGRTAIVIAHRLKTVERADDIAIFEQGRLVEFGPRAVLATDSRSRYAGLIERDRGGSSQPRVLEDLEVATR